MEGLLAKLGYRSLRKMHLRTLHGTAQSSVGFACQGHQRTYGAADKIALPKGRAGEAAK